MGQELAKKLLLHKAKYALLLNASSEYLTELILPENVTLISDQADHQADFVQLFVLDSLQLKTSLEVALQALTKDGILWVSYPKKSSKVKSDLNRDVLVGILRERGYEGVTLISIDNIWSAMRVKPLG